MTTVDGEEEEIMVVHTQQDDDSIPICPITRAEIVKPMKNHPCNHIYSHDAITQLIKAPYRQTCPVAGPSKCKL